MARWSVPAVLIPLVGVIIALVVNDEAIASFIGENPGMIKVIILAEFTLITLYCVVRLPQAFRKYGHIKEERRLAERKETERKHVYHELGRYFRYQAEDDKQEMCFDLGPLDRFSLDPKHEWFLVPFCGQDECNYARLRRLHQGEVAWNCPKCSTVYREGTYHNTEDAKTLFRHQVAAILERKSKGETE